MINNVLPDDVLEYIFLFVNRSTIDKCKRVCRDWRRIISPRFQLLKLMRFLEERRLYKEDESLYGWRRYLCMNMDKNGIFCDKEATISLYLFGIPENGVATYRKGSNIIQIKLRDFIHGDFPQSIHVCSERCIDKLWMRKNRTCPFVYKSGMRRGEICGKIIPWRYNSDFCRSHKMAVAKRMEEKRRKR